MTFKITRYVHGGILGTDDSGMALACYTGIGFHEGHSGRGGTFYLGAKLKKGTSGLYPQERSIKDHRKAIGEIQQELPIEVGTIQSIDTS